MPPQQNQVPPPAPQAQSAPAAAQPSQALAIVALVLGVIGLIPWAGTLFALAAVIVGFISLSHIKKGTAAGHGVALTGVILGFVGLAITALMIGGFIIAVITGIASAPMHQ